MPPSLTDAIWSIDDVKHPELLVLLAMAKLADKQDICSASYQEISQLTNMSARQVRRLIKNLIGKNHVAIQASGIGRGKPTQYILQPSTVVKLTTDSSGTVDKLTIDSDGTMDKLTTDSDTTVVNLSTDNDEKTPDTTIGPSNTTVLEGARAHPRQIPSHPSIKDAKRKLKITSQYLSKESFVDGMIPHGTGTNAVEVYYERFMIQSDKHRLNPIHEDDLIRECKDLDRFRRVVIDYSQHGHYQPRNIKLMLDWYHSDKYKHGKEHHNGTPQSSVAATAESWQHDQQADNPHPF